MAIAVARALNQPVGPKLHSVCPVVMLPSGVRRDPADLPAARLLVVDDGIVLVRTYAEAGARSIVVARCGPGAIMPPPGAGEYLQALTDAWVTAVPGAVWPRILAVPELAERFVAGLEETLLRQRTAARSFAGVRSVDRVRCQLLELAREHGRVCRDGIRIDLPLSHDLISDMVGCARETVTRAFEELQREGFVERRGAAYQLRIRPEALSA
jgi:CRP-like cAMP-binding protein